MGPKLISLGNISQTVFDRGRWRASMGPKLISLGNRANLANAIIKGELQWGPSLSAWEIAELLGGADRADTALQWGPSLSAWEMPMSSEQSPSTRPLQWGPSLSAWEMIEGPRII